MTIADFRMLALAIPGTLEGEHMKHPDFRVGGKIFASLGAPDVGWGMVKLTPKQQRAVIAEAPGAFRPCNGAWGQQGCTNVFLAEARARSCRPRWALRRRIFFPQPRSNRRRSGRLRNDA